MLRFLSLAAALFVTFAALQPAAARATLWAGVGTQTERGVKPMRWTIRVAIDPSGHARIRYPSLNCGGVLTPLRRSGRVMVYRERIRFGHAICVDNGTVLIIHRGNRLDWRWRGEASIEPTLRARAVLLPLRHRRR